MNNSKDDHILEELEREKAIISSKIEDLKKELLFINKLIIRKKLISEPVNRKNINRIFSEGLILEGIGKSKNGLKTKEIEKYLKSIGHEINENTIRSYIARMRDKGLIKKAPSYRWKIAKSPSETTSQN